MNLENYKIRARTLIVPAAKELEPFTPRSSVFGIVIRTRAREEIDESNRRGGDADVKQQLPYVFEDQILKIDPLLASSRAQIFEKARFESLANGTAMAARQFLKAKSDHGSIVFIGIFRSPPF